jgi:hypothetical protein
LVLVPPTPTPPFDVVLLVLAEVGLVAVPLELLVVELLMLDVGVVVGGVVVVELVVVVGLVLEVDELWWGFWQSLAARSPTVVAPRARSWTRVVLTVEGRFSISLLNAVAALVAAPH